MSYNEIYSRNLGLIKKKDQKRIKKQSILICGLGGMGGVCAEVLVRMGYSNLTLIDYDKYELSNLNRQVNSTKNNIGEYKVSVLSKHFKKINPKLKIKIYKEKVSQKNIKKILKNIDFVVNGMDDFLSSIILERSARKKGITIIDAWLTPFASVFVMKPEDPHWEKFLKLNTYRKKIKHITDEDLQNNLIKEVQYTLSHFEPYRYISKKDVKRVLNGNIKRPSLCPVVWLSGILMANEILKLTLNIQSSDYRGYFFNQYDMEFMRGKDPSL